MKIIRLTTFDKAAKKAGVSEEWISELAKELAADPTAGDVVQGTGGVRKYRKALPGGGKSGGARVIHFAHLNNGEIFLITVYKKSAQENLSDDQKKAIKKLVKELTS